MNKLEWKIGRGIWYCVSLGGLLLLIADTALPQGDVKVMFEFPESIVTANEPVYVRLSIDNGLGEKISFLPARYNDYYFDLSVTEPGGRTLQADTIWREELLHFGRVSVP